MVTINYRLEPHTSIPYHTGVAIPVFSLRSEQSFGVGDFSDLKSFADFVAKSGMDLIQILPINDTTTFMDWRDSYPYRAISVFALHPIYLDMSVFREVLTDSEKADFDAQQKSLNALETVDYEAVLAAKWHYIKIGYEKLSKNIFSSMAFLDFFAQNRNWLEPYAAFCYLRDLHHTSDYSQWGEFAKFSKDKLKKLSTSGLNLHYFVQFLLHQQLKSASDYAHALGVGLKGDIAIGIAHDSADAWSDESLYNMDLQTGAPPDAFSETGQNWGFPTYNWDKMAETNFAWWQQRLTVMREYFDAYRLDHILGFFRIWEIPNHSVRALLGQFSPALGLTVDEIENTYQIPFNSWGGDDRFTQPFIRDWVVRELAGTYNDKIFAEFLEPRGNGNYRFKACYNTQKKIAAQVSDEQLRDILFTLQENVLFLADHRTPGLYHPRIKFMDTLSFREFGDEQVKQNLMRLHNDYFYTRHNDFWKEKAYQKLPVIKNATDMLSCGEDLGMVPDNVPDVMWHLQILRLMIERMPSDSAHIVNNLDWAPYLSVVSTSSHDTSTLRQWWKEDPAFTQKYYNDVMHWWGNAPGFMTQEIATEIIQRHMNSDAMLAVFPLQDLLAMTSHCLGDESLERINQPEIPFHYWRYRNHLSNETLLADDEITSKIKGLIAITRRHIGR